MRADDVLELLRLKAPVERQDMKFAITEVAKRIPHITARLRRRQEAASYEQGDRGPRWDAISQQEDHDAKRLTSTDGMARQDDPLLFAWPLVQIPKVVFDFVDEPTAVKLSTMASDRRVHVDCSKRGVADAEAGVGEGELNSVHRGLGLPLGAIEAAAKGHQAAILQSVLLVCFAVLQPRCPPPVGLQKKKAGLQNSLCRVAA